MCCVLGVCRRSIQVPGRFCDGRRPGRETDRACRARAAEGARLARQPAEAERTDRKVLFPHRRDQQVDAHRAFLQGERRIIATNNNVLFGFGCQDAVRLYQHVDALC